TTLSLSNTPATTASYTLSLHDALPIYMGQLRAVARAANFKPTARRRVFILDGAETMRWDLANIFLKILEEPPESATLILLAPNPYLLLSTIRSRCLQFYFAPLSTEQLEEILKRR